LTTLKKSIFTIIGLSLILCACTGSKKLKVDKEEPTHENLPDKKQEDTEVLEEKKLLFDFVNAPLLSDVLILAKEQHKWIYMDVGAKWCVPCQLMKRDVYTHPSTADFFNEHFIPYLVDGESNEGPDLRLIFEINSYPTLLFVDENGRAMLKIESALSASALMEFGQSAVEKKVNERK
jgi:thioredoxin-related protein